MEDNQKLTQTEAANLIGFSIERFRHYFKKDNAPPVFEVIGGKPIFMRDQIIAWKTNLQDRRKKNTFGKEKKNCE